MGATALVQDNSLTVLNPRNSEHQQSNLACRLRFSSKDEFDSWLNDSVDRFRLLGLQPRYSVDELSRPSLNTLKAWFADTKDHGFHLQDDTDVIMACTFDDYVTRQQQRLGNAISSPAVIRATLAHVEDLVQLIGAAFGYGEKIDWLRHKITNQIKDPQTAVYATVNDKQPHSKIRLTSVVIVNSPDGLPNLIHINVCATHPDYQRHGLSMFCMSQALNTELRQGRTAYLEVYDEIKHAQRMYERVGFKVQGTLEYTTVTLPHQI